jgi:hypothetical protein
VVAKNLFRPRIENSPDKCLFSEGPAHTTSNRNFRREYSAWTITGAEKKQKCMDQTGKEVRNAKKRGGVVFEVGRDILAYAIKWKSRRRRHLIISLFLYDIF